MIDRKTKGYQAWRSGRWAEWLAAVYLMAKGYRILGRRVETPYGEIDLVAKRSKTLIFVEVKFRSTLRDAAYSLQSPQKKRIVKAAQFLCIHHFKFELIRFDVILLSPKTWPCHLKNVRLQVLN